MPRNVEIKARARDLAALQARVGGLADSGPTRIDQDDTFFARADGRLKLRAFSPSSGELIFYRRADRSGPKESFYAIARTSEPDALRECLTLAYGQAGRVRKRRTLFAIGRTRVHLDEVEGLGPFLELEVVLREGEPAEEGQREARELMERLGVLAEDLIEGAYVDLLRAAGRL